MTYGIPETQLFPAEKRISRIGDKNKRFRPARDGDEIRIAASFIKLYQKVYLSPSQSLQSIIDIIGNRYCYHHSRVTLVIFQYQLRQNMIRKLTHIIMYPLSIRKEVHHTEDQNDVFLTDFSHDLLRLLNRV